MIVPQTQRDDVYGVTYDSEWNACHVCANSLNELKKIQSSKYVQANTQHSHSDIKAKLMQGKKVLFSGTACQVGGLKSFLKKDYDNLLTMDLVCHGVNSPLLFKKYIVWLEKQKNFKSDQLDNLEIEVDGIQNTIKNLKNKVGEISEDELFLLDFIKPWTKFRLSAK